MDAPLCISREVPVGFPIGDSSLLQLSPVLFPGLVGEVTEFWEKKWTRNNLVVYSLPCPGSQAFKPSAPHPLTIRDFLEKGSSCSATLSATGEDYKRQRSQENDRPGLLQGYYCSQVRIPFSDWITFDVCVSACLCF